MDVWTARISTKDPDAFNVTRKGGDPVFAPSWGLLRTVLDARRAGIAQTEEDWRSYASNYLREMAHSYRANRQAWDALRARERVVLTCYCTNPRRCHRTLLGHVLAQLGASFHGELPLPKVELPLERDLFAWAMSLDDES